VFVNAALQVRWAQLAAALSAGELAPIQPGWLCPVCGSRPVASLLDSPGATPRLRYLACSLCDSRWHYTRAVCADCGEGKSVAYHEIEGIAGPARAETCDECESYVKLLQCDKDPDVDAFADDLASAGLDIMVQEAGWQRNAPNPFLLTG
jgi:FdhE protein